MPAAPPESTPDDAPDATPATKESAPHPGLIIAHPSDGLAEVFYRAALIGDELGGEFNLSFTSILLGLRASDTPSSRWLRIYTKSIGITVARILRPKKTTPSFLAFLEEVGKRRGRLLGPEGRLTRSAVKMLKAANELAAGINQQPLLVSPHHLIAAYIYRCPKEHEGDLVAWGFSRVNWSVNFLAFIGSVPELRDRELNHWTEIHRQTFGSEPSAPPVPGGGEAQAPEAEPAPDLTPLHLDNPSEADYLGRRGFAEALAVRLNRVWQECNPRGVEPSGRSSFILHLHGPWGSGKTSLLNFLKRELQPGRAARDGSPGWVVVEFNAWQNQRISPPWWPLLDTIYARSVKQLADREAFGEAGAARRIRMRERWWRLRTGRKEYFVALGVAVVALLAFVLWFRPGGSQGDTENLLKSVGAVVSAVGVIWTTFLVAGRTLLSGSARSAQSFLETAGDPMERVGAHFRELVGWVGRPVVVFIDDLDRCQSKYVVELLEGVQTLFSDPRVVYVVAADRRWLHTCFETAYKEFAAAVQEPGRRLGSLFLEKAFELSVSVPRLSDEMRQVYWDYLVGGAQSDFEQAVREKSAEVEGLFAGAETEEQVFKRLGDDRKKRAEGGAEKRDPLRDQVLRGAAVRRLSSNKAVASTEYFLKPFAPLLEPNPRAMKRLVNAYSVLRDMALLADADVVGDISQRRQLALWAIVSLRWPLLEEYLEAHPEVIDSIRDGQMYDGEKKPLVPNKGLQKLAESEEVRKVFKGAGTTPAGLQREVVCKIVGISAAQATAASVA